MRKINKSIYVKNTKKKCLNVLFHKEENWRGEKGKKFEFKGYQ